ncbi:MAG: hypothetical protein QW597_00310 [Thermoplasmataceae archaeon]
MPEITERKEEEVLDQETVEHHQMEKWRIHFLVYAIIYLNFSFVMWYYVGYLNIAALVAIWAMIVISAFFILYAVAFKTRDFPSRILPLIAFSFALVAVIAAYVQFFPGATTDEMIIDSYAANLTLHGIDPYVNANMANVFVGININGFLSTPLLSGGLVTFFEYPGLAALIYIPAIILGVPAFSVTVFFDIASLFLVFLYYKKKKFAPSTLVLALVMGLVAEYGIFSSAGVTDIIWVFFLGLSYAFRKKPWISGLFYGLSVAFKQIPAIIFPFFLYFIYKENVSRERSVFSFTGFTAISFFSVNALYIAQNPMDWLSNVVSIISQKIIGIGIGPSILSFTGVIPLPPEFFSVCLIALTITLFFIYIIHYDRFKYGFFAFPVIILLLDYRSLINYLIYWPLLVLLILPDFLTKEPSNNASPKAVPRSKLYFLLAFEKSAIRNKKATAVVVVILIFLATVISAGFYYSQTVTSPVTIKVNSVGNPDLIAGNITYMQLNVSYLPSMGDPPSLGLNYRIFPNSIADGNGGSNGMLWYGDTYHVHAGNNIIDIYPLDASYLLPAKTTFFTVTAYSNITTMAPATFLYNKTLPSVFTPINNPSLMYPMDVTTGYAYPGWKWLSSAGGSLPVSIPNGVIMTANDSGMKSPVKESITSYIDYSYLVKFNYSLNYSASVIAGGLTYNETAPWTSSYGPVLSINEFLFYIEYNGNSNLNNLVSPLSDGSYVYFTDQKSLNFNAFNRSIHSQYPNIPLDQPLSSLSYELNSQYQGFSSVRISNLSLINGSAKPSLPGTIQFAFAHLQYKSDNFNAFMGSLLLTVTPQEGRTVD